MTKSLKDILTRLCKRVNFRQAQVTGAAVTIAGGGSIWHTVPFPSSGTVIGITGYYLNGGYNCKVYNMNLSASGAQFALKNDGSSSATVTITAYYLVVD